MPSWREAPDVGVLGIVLTVGAALAVSTAPVWLRAAVALPALVLGAGASLARLLTAPAGAADRIGPVDAGTAESSTAETTTFLGWTLPVLLGLVVVLAVALLLNLLRIRLSTLALAVGIEVTGVVLLVLGQVSVRGRTLAPGAQLPRLRPGRAARLGLVAAVTTATLVGAVAAARALQPSDRTAYGVLSLAGSGQDGQLGATAGEPVTVDWVLRGYEGLDVARAGPLTVSLRNLRDGSSADVVARSGPGQGSVGMRAGVTTFTAPGAAGTYRVVLEMSMPAAAPGDPPELGVAANLTVRS